MTLDLERCSSNASFVGSLFRDSFVATQLRQGHGTGTPARESPNSVFFQFPLCSGTVPAARWAHSASLVGSLMYVYGGVGASVLDDMWVLDTDTMTWRLASTSVCRPKDRPEKMLAHAAAVVDRKLWLFGGQQGRKFLRDLFSFNTDTMQWRAHGADSAPAARAGHSMTTISPHEVLLLGGQGKKLYNDLWVLNTSTLGWAELKPSGSPPPARRGHSSAWDGEDRLIVYGGTLATDGDSKVYIYSRSSNIWAAVEPAGESPPMRTSHTAALFSGSSMVIFGGCSHQGVFYNDVWVLDTSSWTWQRPNVLSNTPPPRYNHSCVPLGHKLLLYGGISSKQTFDAVVVLETKLGRDLNLVAEELARMSTTSSQQQVTPSGSQNDLLKMQLQQLLVRRNMEERTQLVTRKAQQVEGKLLEEQEQREALRKEVLQLQLIIRELEEQKLQLESRQREADAKLHRDSLVLEELRAELASVRRGDAERAEQLQEAHSLMDSMSRELGILSSRYTRTKVEFDTLQQASRGRQQQQQQQQEEEEEVVRRQGLARSSAGQVPPPAAASEQQEQQPGWQHTPGLPSRPLSCQQCQQEPCECALVSSRLLQQQQQEQQLSNSLQEAARSRPPGSQQLQELQAAPSSPSAAGMQARQWSTDSDDLAAPEQQQQQRRQQQPGAGAPASSPRASASSSSSSHLQHYKHLWRSSEASRLALEARLASAEAQLSELGSQRGALLAQVARLEGAPDALGSCNLVELREVERLLENATRAVRDTIVERTIAEVQKRASLEHQSCFVCMEAPREVVFNCGHSCCAHCSIKLVNCPFCRQDISQKIKLFDA